MNKKWLIFIDLDGTTLKNWSMNSDGVFNPIVKEVFDILQKIGHIIVINTGRNWKQAKDVYNALELKGPIINFAGGHIHNPNDESFIQHIDKINKSILRDIYNDEKINKYIKGIIVKDTVDWFALNHSSMEIDNLINKYSIPIFNEQFKIDYQSMYMDMDLTYEEAAQVKNFLNEKYSDIVVSQWINPKKNKNVLEINKANSNKGTSIEYLANYYKVPMSRTIGIGDGDNDIEMMKKAGISVAMKNANNTIKELADIITEYDNNDGGVGHFLIKHFNIKIR